MIEIVAHRPRAVRDLIVDREVRRMELIRRAERQAAASPEAEAPGARSRHGA